MVHVYVRPQWNPVKLCDFPVYIPVVVDWIRSIAVLGMLQEDDGRKGSLLAVVVQIARLLYSIGIYKIYRIGYSVGFITVIR